MLRALPNHGTVRASCAYARTVRRKNDELVKRETLVPKSEATFGLSTQALERPRQVCPRQACPWRITRPDTLQLAWRVHLSATGTRQPTVPAHIHHATAMLHALATRSPSEIPICPENI